MLSLLSISWAANVDMPLHKLCSLMRQRVLKFQIILSCAKEFSIDAGFRNFWKLVFLFQNYLVIVSFLWVVLMLTIFCLVVFRSSLKWTLNEANSRRGSHTEETRDKIFLWLIGACFCSSLLVPLQTGWLSSVTVRWSPSTDEPTLIGCLSTCFVLLVDLNSSVISSVTLLQLWSTFSDQIHVLTDKFAVAWKHWYLQECRLTWWNCSWGSYSELLLLQLKTRPRCRSPLVSERTLHILVKSCSPMEFKAAFVWFRNLHLQKHWFTICC